MAKPIFIINRQGYGPQSIDEETQESEMFKSIADKMSDYHVLFTYSCNSPEFQCFNHNLPNIELEELYKKVGKNL